MENYNLNIFDGIHKVKVTLQQFDYAGHIFQNIHGNCFGRDILSFDFESSEGEEENDCDLAYDENYDLFSVVLKNESGDKFEFEGDASELNDMIVAIEIVDYVKE
ncbi:DUF5406 family protein [Anaerosporobacter sp.]|uniref:DUF5406 family protein n=1 Tax=Anaerosporobacter sp. TaxID=1872529 RepID=UPI00286EEDB2|nr:DUF5406 family protein [Anaerosporobacter sp.]